MSLFDSLLGAIGPNLDVAGIASKAGIDPATAQSAIAALTAAHTQPGDTVDTAAAQTGLDPSVLSSIVGQLGGSGGLGQLAESVASNPQAQGMVENLMTNAGGTSGLLGMAEGFFSKQ